MIEHVQGLQILIGTMFGDKRSLEEMLPPSFEELINHNEIKQTVNETFESNTWWKSESN